MVEDKVGRDPIPGEPAHDCRKEASKEEEVELARAEMSQVREENARLKMLLQKIEKDYNSLQMRFVGVSQPSISETKFVDDDKVDNDTPSGNDDEEEPVVSLCLGRSSPIQPKVHNSDHDARPGTTGTTKEKLHQRYDDLKEEGDLRLALDFNHSLEDSKSDPPHVLDLQTTPDPGPLESLKTTTKSCGGDDDLSQSAAKRARVSVRTRCDTPTMNDGCQWRKYGQKIAKGNPCPRAYYRCTVAPSCPVRKQVQRCVHDTSILITTYEGNHNHPLPFSATAMASTTSAAASMLLSGSSSSTSQFASNNSATSTTRQYYLPPNSSPAYPTITLDLTSEPSTTSITQSNMFSSGSGSFQLFPRPTSTSLSFSSSVWANGNLNYGANAMPYRYSPRPGKTSQEQSLHQTTPFANKNYQAAAPSQQALTETLTKAITSDPNLRSVIAAAITTMVGGANANQESNDNKLEGLGKKLKRDDHSTVMIGSSNPTGANGKGCASSLLNVSSFSTPRGGSLGKQQTQPPFSFSKGAAASSTTSENADQTNRMLLD